MTTTKRSTRLNPSSDTHDGETKQSNATLGSTNLPSTRRTLRGTRNEDHESDNKNENINNDTSKDKQSTEENQSSQEEKRFEFDGKFFKTYQEMVNAKRKRNEEVLKGLGFLDSSGSSAFQVRNKNTTTASQRGIKKQKTNTPSSIATPRRKSSRLTGEKTNLVALDYYVDNWTTSNAIVSVDRGEGISTAEIGNDAIAYGLQKQKEQNFYRGRVNDGSDLTIEQAFELNEAKWVQDDALTAFKEFHTELGKLSKFHAPSTKVSSSSPQSVVMDWNDDIKSKAEQLSIDNEDWVAKVTPDRIYSVTAHPSESKLLIGAGDKQGHVGLWDVDCLSDNETNGVHLVRVHSRPICALEWATPSQLVSASYDGTIRLFHVETGIFEQIFGTYDDSDSFYAEELGYGLDEGYNYWIQSVCIDHRQQQRNTSTPNLFVSTSVGTVMHLDLRSPGKERITFHETLSEKKINSLSLHPNGHTLASAGLDGLVKLWDIRKFGNSRHNENSSSFLPKPIATQTIGLSISSSYFSPSGNALLSTSFADRLDMVENPHLFPHGKPMKPTKSVRHNNKTGRWLSTFMATWHPQLDIFVVGSMDKPRCMELFDSKGSLIRSVRGEALTSVMSRCCFHLSKEKLVMIGGNSSGRVAVIR